MLEMLTLRRQCGELKLGVHMKLIPSHDFGSVVNKLLTYLRRPAISDFGASLVSKRSAHSIDITDEKSSSQRKTMHFCMKKIKIK